MFGLKPGIVKLFIFSLLDLVINRLGRYIGILILISLVSRETIGILGIATSYLAFVGYLSLAPENILLRDYKRSKKANLTALLSSYFNFWALRSVGILFLGLLIFLFIKGQSLMLGIVFAGLLLQRLLESASNFIQLTFYVDFKQDKVTRINFFNNLVLLALFALLYFYPSLYTYVVILLVWQFLFVLIWLFKLKEEFGFVYKYSPLWLEEIKKNIWGFSLWYHLGNQTMNFVYNISPLLLSFFVGLGVVGDYTIALKITGIFLVVSSLMGKASFLHFATETGSIDGSISASPSKKNFHYQTIYQHIKVYSIISLLWLVLFALLGKFVIFHFLTKQNTDTIYLLVFIMLLGVLIFNLARPIIALVNARFSLKKAFLAVYLPFLLIALLSYSLLGAHFGIFGIAWASVFNYTLLLLLLIFFKRSQVP